MSSEENVEQVNAISNDNSPTEAETPPEVSF
jgi:hypothetical protein